VKEDPPSARINIIRKEKNEEKPIGFCFETDQRYEGGGEKGGNSKRVVSSGLLGDEKH